MQEEQQALLARQLELVEKEEAFVEVKLIDDWHSWTWQLWLPDCMAPFFLAACAPQEYGCYFAALHAGLQEYDSVKNEV